MSSLLCRLEYEDWTVMDESGACPRVVLVVEVLGLTSELTSFF